MTVRYELEQGLREAGQRAGGMYELTVRRTIAATSRRAYDAFADPAELSRWFATGARADVKVGGRYSHTGGDRGEYLLVEPGKRLRFTWDNRRHSPGSVVEVEFQGKGRDRTTVRLTHSKLRTKKEFEGIRGGWSWALDSLRSYLETGRPIAHEAWSAAKRRSRATSR